MGYPVIYAVKHKNLETRMASRSGGIFTAVSDYIFAQGGVVYGCVLTDGFTAEHIRAESPEERDRMRGSKYIQSHMGDTFRQVKADLEGGRKVLFSGTSCQTAGLRAFLGKEYGGLLCVDIVCHGVPSERVWKEYLKWQEEKNGGKCVAVDFRNKRDFGWAAHVETLTIRKPDGSEKKVSSEVFKNLFFSHNALRPACHKCPYKSTEHPSDITIGDFWGINKALPGFNDEKGVSLVMVNNAAAAEVFSAVAENLEYKECRVEDCLQPALREPTAVSADRARFWSDMDSKPFGNIAKTYGSTPLKKRVKSTLKKIKKKFL